MRNQEYVWLVLRSDEGVQRPKAEAAQRARVRRVAPARTSKRMTKAQCCREVRSHGRFAKITLALSGNRIGRIYRVAAHEGWFMRVRLAKTEANRNEFDSFWWQTGVELVLDQRPDT